MLSLHLPLQEAPAVEFLTEWNATAWTLWWVFVAVAAVLLLAGPGRVDSTGNILWGVGAVAGWVFLFLIAYPQMARHANATAAWGLFALFMALALITYAIIYMINPHGGFLVHLFGAAAPVMVGITGISEGATRNAAQMGMTSGGYIGLLVVGVLVFIAWASKKA